MVPTTAPTIAVLTALPLEYRAVRDHLPATETRVHPYYGTRAEVGRLPGTPWWVALLELGEGTLTAATLTERVLTWFAPQAVLFVGVAGALKEDIALGDVVVATKVYAIHGGKETPDGFLDRPLTWPAPHHLDSAARQALRGVPHVHFKPIAAGDVVLSDADSPLAHRIREHFNDAVAIEMEGSGVAHAAHLAGRAGALIIRGISDRADAGKAQAEARGSQRYAAERAADAAIAVLRELEPRETAPPSRAPHRAGAAGPAHVPVPTASTVLPPRPLGFTGRAADLHRLLAHLDPTADGPATARPLLISALTGMGGIGKTALAIEAAHQARAKGWFPGGTLFVDLRGYDDNPVTSDQAVLALLDALGIRGPDLPRTTARQYDTYQVHLAERRARTLLVLDNASDPPQFLRLLPGSGHHRVLITSRDRPDSLPLHIVDLETLPEDEATALVTTALSNDPHDDRPSREPQALRELTVLCGHLPLALQIAAAMLRRRRSRGIATLVADIKKVGDALSVLDNGSRGTDQYGRSLALRPVLETSYRRLPEDQARLLRLLALAPGSDTGTEAAAALAGLDEDAAVGVLEDLAAACLVTAVRAKRDAGKGDTASGDVRWRLHDLVRAFGVGVTAGDPGLREEGEAARERLLGFYWRWADIADDRLHWLPGRPEPVRFGDRAQALAWLDGERAGLVGAVEWAAEERYARRAVGLALCLAEYLRCRRYFSDGIAIARTAGHAARRAGDRLGEAAAWTKLGSVLREAGRAEEAVEAHGRARDLFRAAGDRLREATAWNNLGNALRKAGRSGEAVDAHTHARDLFRTVGDRHREAIAWNNLGLTLQDTGRAEEATEAYGKALEIHREFEDWYKVGQTLRNLAASHERAQRFSEAGSYYLLASDAFDRADADTEGAMTRDRAREFGQPPTPPPHPMPPFQ